MKETQNFNHSIQERQKRTFSEGIKQKLVSDLEKNLVNVADICKTYNVSRTSVYRWIYKYSNMAKKGTRQIVEAKSDTRKIMQLEERIKELERTVGRKQMMIDFKDKMIEIAEKDYNVDIKKKVGSRLLNGSESTDPGTDIR